MTTTEQITSPLAHARRVIIIVMIQTIYLHVGINKKFNSAISHNYSYVHVENCTVLIISNNIYIVEQQYR